MSKYPVLKQTRKISGEVFHFYHAYGWGADNAALVQRIVKRLRRHGLKVRVIRYAGLNGVFTQPRVRPGE